MKKVTLTFDNGPTPDVTSFVLDELHSRNLQAWFCVVGTQLERGHEQVDLALETKRRGHHIVNHSLTHTVPLGDNVSDRHARSEILDMHQLMNSLLGDWGARWFRPFGRGGLIGKHIFSEMAVAELRRSDYSVLLWNSVPRDWEDPDGWPVTAFEQIGQRDHTVLVLHDLPTGAMDRLPGFLDELGQQGYDVTTSLPDDCVPIKAGHVNWPDERFSVLVNDPGDPA